MNDLAQKCFVGQAPQHICKSILLSLSNIVIHHQNELSRCYQYHETTYVYPTFRGRRVIGISGSLIWSKTLMELISNPCGEIRWSPEDSAKSTLLSSMLGPLGSFQMLKGEWGAESNGKLPHLFVPSNTATLVPEFTVEDLYLDRTATLFPEFFVNDLPLGRTHCCVLLQILHWRLIVVLYFVVTPIVRLTNIIAIDMFNNYLRLHALLTWLDLKLF